MPEGVRGALTPLKHAVLGPPPPPTLPGVVRPGFIPSASRCYWINLGLSVSGIRLNIAGREPDGVLQPRDVEAFSEELSRELLALLDPETGRPLVERLRWTRDLFAGDQVDRLPDLVVDWDLVPPVGSETIGTGAGAVRRATSPRIGTLVRTNRYCRSGEHRNEGMFIAHGEGIRAATIGRVISNMDLAPTFARLLGTDMTDVDGRPIPELLS
jgi:predicted AlkP superfamily phosphohydrolase/phosphomutase